MSLYEIQSMVKAVDSLDKTHKPKVTDDQWQQSLDLIKSVTANDPKVRLH